MSHGYRVVQWTPFKKAFDIGLVLGVLAFLAAYVAAATLTQQPGQSFTPIQLLIRALGALAFSLLTLILCIGPLARLSRAFSPALYNRRHLGVTCFLVSLAHASLVLLWYHGFADLNPLVSLLVSNPRYNAIGGFPFESLGLIALLVLSVLAATSHDFWNANLGPVVWKAIHMSVYGAYVLVVAHVLLGAVQSARLDVYAWLVLSAAALVSGLHIIAALREHQRDAPLDADGGGWIEVCPASDILDTCARIVTPPKGERIAVFRDGARVFALSNVCRHQGGPLGEGRIVDGCVVCPWHGFQYRPEDGRSPPPFTEMVSTYRTKIQDGMVYVHETPSPPGEAMAPSLIATEGAP
jgi:nitrite reductase/ring-hydroxylating ferredoxin subunit/DMSO/TMAO reductase YedYZ heme-binding membrane subunit